MERFTRRQEWIIGTTQRGVDRTHYSNRSGWKELHTCKSRWKLYSDRGGWRELHTDKSVCKETVTKYISIDT